MVNIVRAFLGLEEEDGKEIAKAVKTIKKKEKKAKAQKKTVHGEEPREVEPDAE
jgi:hypothetical protein